MKHEKRHIWRYITLRAYLEKGMVETRFVNYFLVVFGVERAVADDYTMALLVGIGYFALCLVIGWIWDVRRYYTTEYEWRNRRNDFVREMREAIKR